MERASRRKYHYIYKITCKVTNRFYIGMHSTDNLEDEYFGSGKRLWYSINKHGKENHVKEILEYLSSRQLLKEREKEIVNKELLDNNLCMNLQEGGGGGLINEEHKKKFINAGINNFNKSFEKRKKIISELRNDDEISKKWFDKIKHGLIKYYENNEAPFKSKKHKKETKEKIGNTNSIKQMGSLNSQYGTSWITKEGINKKIKKEDLETYLKQGWAQGRK
jgi:hypothetical protein